MAPLRRLTSSVSFAVLSLAVGLSSAACGSSAGQPAQLPFQDDARPMNFGDDAALDQLWQACDDGDGAACDRLWELAPVGSDYESFAATCGNRSLNASSC